MDIRAKVAQEMRDENKTNLTDSELDCLEALVGHADFCLPFKAIAVYVGGLDISEVRGGCRALASKGLAFFQRGLMTEDGEMAGSGYGITPEGRKVWDAMSPDLLEKGRAYLNADDLDVESMSV